MLDSSIPLMAKGIDGLKMLEDGSQIAQLWQNQKTDGELNRLYKEANGDLNKMLEIGKTSPMARFVMPQLQAQQAAQQKAALDQQKIEAEIGKTNSETGQNNATTQGKNLANAQTLLTAANQALYVATQSGDANAVKLALNNAKTAGLLDEATYNQYFATAEGLSTNPKGLKSFALNLQKAYAQNPEKYNFTTADNVLDNQTLVGNAQLSADVQREKIKQEGQIAQEKISLDQAKLSVEQAKIELEQKKGTVQQFGDGLYMVYPNGSAVPINSPTGQPVVKSTTTAAQQSAKSEENTRIQRVETIIPEIRTLLSKATGSYLGAGADLLANTVGISTEGAKATAQLKTLSGQMVAAMPKMSGPQSDKDVAMYKDMAGNLSDPTIPIETRLAALKTIEKLNEKYKVLNSSGIPATIAKPSNGGKPNAIDFFKD